MENKINNELSIEEKAKAARKEYMKKYRAEHKEQIKAKNERYWAKKFDQNLG